MEKKSDLSIAEKVKAYNAKKKIKETTGLDSVDESSMTALAVGTHRNADNTWTVVVLKYDPANGVGVLDHSKVVEDKTSAAEQFKIFAADRLAAFNAE